MLFCLSSCLETTDFTLGLSDDAYSFAIPLVNTRITVGRLAEQSTGNAGIRIDSDGKATVLYNGEVLRKSAAAIFPPFPGLIAYNIPDTLSTIQLQFNNSYLIKKAIFQDTKINFYFQHNYPQDVKVTMRILELTKNGKVFEQTYNVPYKQTLPVSTITDPLSIDGYTLLSNNNSLTFQYVATLPDGSRIKLDQAQMNYDVIKFSYIDGYLGYHVFAVDGNIIDVGLFNPWLSGSFDFQNPKITLSVDNAFGLPVRSRINKMELTSITGKQVKLESPFVTTGIDFAYPSFSEQGKIKTTNFDFNRNNSNIRDIFNEKTKTISYDISALVNPERDTTIKGFITGDSYFVVRVAVEVPLLASVNQVVIGDTLDIDLSQQDEVVSAEFKAITTNDFPADLSVQAFFLDDQGNPIEALFAGAGYTLPAATLAANGKTMPGKENTLLVPMDSERYQRIRHSKRVAILGTINTTGSERQEPVWIYDNYGLGVRLGVKFTYKKK
jgi:hypothetical protein